MGIFAGAFEALRRKLVKSAQNANEWLTKPNLLEYEAYSDL